MGKISRPLTSRSLAVFCARIAEEKIAKDTVILNLSKIDVAPANFFVICTCDSENQMKAIAGEIEKRCKDFELPAPKTEGLNACQWVLLDMFDVVVHIMLPETREYYKLERLWGDSQFLKLNEKVYRGFLMRKSSFLL